MQIYCKCDIFIANQYLYSLLPPFSPSLLINERELKKRIFSATIFLRFFLVHLPKLPCKMIYSPLLDTAFLSASIVEFEMIKWHNTFMRREEITPADINTILGMAAEVIHTPEKVDKIRESQTPENPFPFIPALLGLGESPEKVTEIFHEGSLRDDLERVAGLSWKWDVSADKDNNLAISFRENVPQCEKTEKDMEREAGLNKRVYTYLNKEQ